MSTLFREELLPLLIVGQFTTAIHTVTGVAAIWAALGKAHWFWRAAALLLSVAPWVAIDASELVVAVLIQAVLTSMPLWMIRATMPSSSPLGIPWPAERAKLTFSLLDLLLLMIVVAGACALGKEIGTTILDEGGLAPWFETVSEEAWTGVAFGIVSLTAGCASIPRGRWLTVATRIVFCMGSFAAAFAMLDTTLWYMIPLPVVYYLPVGLVTGGLTLAWTIAMRNAGKLALPSKVPPTRSDEPTDSSSRSTPRFRMAKALLLFVTLVIIGPALLLYGRLLIPRPIPPSILPEPNGYDDLVRVANRLSEVHVRDDDFQPPTYEVLQSFSRKYGPVLATAHKALEVECQRPITLEEDSADNNFAFLKLGEGFHAKGLLAAADGGMDEAIGWHLDAARLGVAIARGGFYVDYGFGQSIFDHYGIRKLSLLRTKMSGDQCHRLAHALLEINARREPFDEVYERDSIWAEHRGASWRSRLSAAMESLGADAHGHRREMRRMYNEERCRIRLLAVDLAVRAHWQESGNLRQRLDDLVGGQFDKLPLDPFTGQPFVYRRHAGEFELYSIGPDGFDGRGERYDHQTKRGDIILDPPAAQDQDAGRADGPTSGGRPDPAQ